MGPSKHRIFQSTYVQFIDATGETEDGKDQGGLTSEMYAMFFRELALPSTGLFESVEGTSIGLLPAPTADPMAMYAIGRVLCKCLLDDHPIGKGLGIFVFEYLASGHDLLSRRVFRSADRALAVLRDFDPKLASTWANLLANPCAGLSLDNFVQRGEGDDELPDEELPTTAESFEYAIIAGCRQRLYTCREEALKSLRSGFTSVDQVDFTVQLGAFTSEQLAFMMRGKLELSQQDLIDCFQLPDAPSREAEDAGFDEVGSQVPKFFRAILEDSSPTTGLNGTQRLEILEWATALTALPCSGLKDKIKLKFYEAEEGFPLPMNHTCTHEVHICDYPSREMLQAKLLQAVEHRGDGFLIE